MKKNLVLAAVFLFPYFCSAEEATVKVPVPEGFQTMQMEEMPAEISQKKSKVIFSSSCTDVTGRVIKQGEAGYETCLNEVKFKNTNPEKSADSKTTAPGPQMNMNFSVGD